MNKTIFGAAGLVIFALGAPTAWAQTSSAASPRDVTSATQPESAMDADLSDRVRRSVVSDRNLSSYAAKITIVSNDGVVHLSGLVQNDGEKAQIANKAAVIAGPHHIVNDLRVMTNVADGSGLRDLLRRASEPHAAVVAAN